MEVFLTIIFEKLNAKMSLSKLYKSLNLRPFTEGRRLMLLDRRRKVNEGGGSGRIWHNSLDF